MVVPEAYGFKSVKWLKRLVITNKYQAADTYAKQNNSVNDSWMKTRALFEDVADKVQPNAPYVFSELEDGSCSWIRTNDLVVNSHPLYR